LSWKKSLGDKFILRIKKYIRHFGDKLILRFEKYVSNFGTNPLQALCWLLGLNFLFLFTYHFDFGVPCLELPYTLLFFKNSYEEYGISWLHLVHFIVNVYLIYELQKSLRKFSRRL
jgi:hypothetical protein